MSSINEVFHSIHVLLGGNARLRFDLSPRFLILQVIRIRKASSVYAISQMTGLDRSVVKREIQSLKQETMIEVTPSSYDHPMQIQLTPDGVRFIEMANYLNAPVIFRYLTGLPSDELRELLRILDKLVCNLNTSIARNDQ